MFKKYYQDELTYLRELGKEFAAAYPAIGPMLAETGGDPEVERLLEGVAFLTGKLRQKLDDELPEVIHSIAALLFPNYVRQVPAASMLEFTPLPNVVREKVVVPRGAEVAATPIGDVSCRFRTTQSVDLLPLAISSVRVDTSQLNQALRIELRLTSGVNMAALELDRLRFFIHGERRVQDQLRLWLAAHLDGISVAATSSTRDDVTVTTLHKRHLKLAGFEDDESLIPYQKTVYPGYRLLQEFFSLPQKFSFFDISGLEQLPAERLGEGFALWLQFNAPLPAGTRISAENLKLFCTPVINLFSHSTDPIKPDSARQEYLARPSGGKPEGYEIYSIDKVTGIARRSNQRVEIPSFFRFQHELASGQNEDGGYYHPHLRSGTLGEGVDTYLSFGSPKDGGASPEFDVISVEATCTNRRLPSQLKAGSIRVATATSPAVASFKNIIGVTQPLPPPIGHELQWRVLAHMAMSYRSIAEADVLRSTIDIYNFQALHDRQAARANQLRVAAIRDVSVAPTDRLHRGAPVRGVRVTIELDENGFSGEGEMYLFASILNEMFASYVSLNSFTQLRIRGSNTNVVYEWEPKSGNQLLI